MRSEIASGEFNPCPAEPGHTLPLETAHPGQLASESAVSFNMKFISTIWIK